MKGGREGRREGGGRDFFTSMFLFLFLFLFDLNPGNVLSLSAALLLVHASCTCTHMVHACVGVCTCTCTCTHLARVVQTNLFAWTDCSFGDNNTRSNRVNR